VNGAYGAIQNTLGIMKEQHQETFLDIASVQTIIGKQFFTLTRWASEP
jgi:hypothetical protein